MKLIIAMATRSRFTFDPMAVALDWLDAYRAASLSIVDLYCPDAIVECACGGRKVARGQAAISEYWRRHFVAVRAGELIALLPAEGGVSITYRVPDGQVRATLYFNLVGKIARSVCGPTGADIV